MCTYGYGCYTSVLEVQLLLWLDGFVHLSKLAKLNLDAHKCAKICPILWMFKTEKSAVPILDIRKCRVYTLENWKSKRFKTFGLYHSPTSGGSQRLPFWCRYITISLNWVFVIENENLQLNIAFCRDSMKLIVLSLLLWIVIRSIQSGCSIISWPQNGGELSKDISKLKGIFISNNE